MATTSSRVMPDSLLNKAKSEETFDCPERSLSTARPIPENSEHFNVALGSRSYINQYAGIYFMRLAELKPSVVKSVSRSWNQAVIDGQSVIYVDKVLDIRENTICWVAGTIYKELKYKPSMLEEVTRSHWGAPPPVPEKYIDPGTDEISLEDESGRVKLVGEKIKSVLLTTGCTIAVMGIETPGGDFDVIDIRLPEFAIQKPFPLRTENKDGRISNKKASPRYLALVSGLEFTADMPHALSVDLLAEFLRGELGGSNTSNLSSDITRLIVAGNSIASPSAEAFEEEGSVVDDLRKSAKLNSRYGHNAVTFDPKPLEHLDDFLANICFSIPVDIMPGEKDPGTISLPQQPMHPIMFPKARKYGTKRGEEPILYETFSSVTNPNWWDIDGVRILGTSGQTIDDIFKYVEGDDRLAMIESTLRWRHLAPTAPDTLNCYPFVEYDPFVINETPHVYFVGNQPRFETRLVEGYDCIDERPVKVRIISVPKFCETGEIVLVNLDNLETESVKFSIDL
ncbi:hypothetical protein NADFUDRAFT_82357 [Nadsonia fulvescens var. elongata DSM 6958]|uniref:DNA-directed DNA polymerase n=1 Tax=Nadsonia fulvescens var. elongata DSM 6958 TaxID=857566 RepID=A0A1E3PMC5_9ASCO|nr:hypothetical protein NADFUDRAFT_82357 [Nadsonia fulvescens var. elongata DSM 6958]